MAEITIRPMRPQDWPQASRAFAEGIARHRTFHTELPSWEVWNQAHLPGCRLVAERDGAVVGFVALSPVSARACYRGVAEVSLYVLREAQGQQIGTRLLFAAVEASEAAGIWSLLSNIFADNEPSLAVHRRCGFRLVGRRERIAQDGAGSWKDMAMMERRSAVTGL